MRTLLPTVVVVLGPTGSTPREPLTPANPPPTSAAALAASAVENKVVAARPMKTKEGTPFNVQLDRGSGISFELSRPVPPGDIKVSFDGKPLGSVAANGVIVTATSPGNYLAAAGRYPVTLQLPGSTTALPAGNFTVE